MANDAVVAAEVALAETVDVELQFVEETGEAVAGEGGGVACVTAEELVGSEAGEEDARWCCVGLGGVGGRVVDGAAASGGKV